VASAVAGASIAEPELAELWGGLLDAIKRASPFIQSYFNAAHPVSLVNNVFTIGFDPEFSDQIQLVNSAKNRDLVHTKLAELGHPNVQVKFIEHEGPAVPSVAAPAVVSQSAPTAAPVVASPSSSVQPEPRAAKPAPAPKASDDFKNDPLIQKALEVFKGQIVDVRS
jgi:hypothetical protein